MEPTKAQKRTFDNIEDFFSLSEELVLSISDNVHSFTDREVLDRLDIVEKFIEDATYATEVVAENYTKLVKYNPSDAEELKEQMAIQIINMIEGLNFCREELLKRVK